MNRVLTSVVITFLTFLGLTSSAPAQSSQDALKLHPNGFGEHSYSSWKGQQGLPDLTGTSNQALYFQKMTTTATFAAGVAVIEGFEGMDASAITALAFDWRMDGHCGAGAPRFNIRIKPPAGPSYTYFVGCEGMVPGEMKTDPAGRMWETRRNVLPLPPGTITALAIVFDEGDDVGQGFVFLDNITVNSKVWTSAADNGTQ